MTPNVLDIAQKVKSMTEPEVEYLWDVIKKRHDESLLAVIDMKLVDSTRSDSLSETEAKSRLTKLGIA